MELLASHHQIAQVLYVCALLLTIVFDIYERFRDRKEQKPAKATQSIKIPLQIIIFLLLAVMYNLSDIAMFRNDLASQLISQYAVGNLYVKDRLVAKVDEMQNQLKQNEIEFPTSDLVESELLAAVTKAQKGDFINAIDYEMVASDSDPGNYWEANIAAAKRGVNVTRIFAITEEMCNREGGEQTATRLWKTIRQQVQADPEHIKVKVIMAEEIPKNQWSHYRGGLVILHYGTSRLVMRQTSRTSNLDIFWDADKVDREENYFSSLLELKSLQEITTGIDRRPFCSQD